MYVCVVERRDKYTTSRLHFRLSLVSVSRDATDGAWLLFFVVVVHVPQRLLSCDGVGICHRRNGLRFQTGHVTLRFRLSLSIPGWFIFSGAWDGRGSGDDGVDAGGDGGGSRGVLLPGRG